MLKHKGVTLLEIIVVIAMVVILGAIIVPTAINYSHKISRGEVVDKTYTAEYVTYSEKRTIYHPAKCTLTIEGEKNGKMVKYTFDVPESEYLMYSIGEWYPKESSRKRYEL
jgi:prepilin-type N-terminal cleavage/methylation domain-containing protein